MPLPVLVTQCLQRDFVGPVGPHDPLPNRLHVGSAEALRLLGPDPERGPVAQLLAWARGQEDGALPMVHVRDWHDADDARQHAHLAAFGPHCLRGSDGAAFVFPAPPDGSDEHVVDAIGLNDFEGTRLPDVIEALRARSPDGRLRIAVVGVWTEAKVTFLLYDLATRAGVDELATCSALTASASRSQHFVALEQLEKILGVRRFDTVGELSEWLVPDGEPLDLAPPAGRRGPRLGADGLTEPEQDILGYLYRDAARLELLPLGGGFSGARVFRVRSFDAVGHEAAPSVAKLGPRALIGKERVAFERVEDILGNDAPRVRGFVDLGDRAGISYAYAAMGRGEVRTLKSLYERGEPLERVQSVISTVFEDVLGRFYAAAQYERLPLLEHYGFEPRWGPSVAFRVREITGSDADRLVFPGGLEAENVARFYIEHLPRLGDAPEYHYTSWVHGDLNGANVLVDGRENVWVIDWFHARRAHALLDLAKLENDLLYLFTALADEGELAQAVRVTVALRGVTDLRAPLGGAPPGVTAPGLLRAWEVLRQLRSNVGRLCKEDRDPRQLRVALLRYAAHTLSFDEASPLQKRWALASACALAEDVVRGAHPARLRVDWLAPADLPVAGRLGLTICPGRRDRGRDLAADLSTLAGDGTTDLVCLLPADEMGWLGVPDLRTAAEARGLRFHHLPIRDQGVPSLEEAAELVGALRARLDQGARIVVHCMGGLGRSGTIAACVVSHHGKSAPDAIAAVRRARDPRAVETIEQERFVARYVSA